MLFDLFRSERRGLGTVALANVVQGLSDSFAQVFRCILISADEIDTLTTVASVGILDGCIVYPRVEKPN